MYKYYILSSIFHIKVIIFILCASYFIVKQSVWDNKLSANITKRQNIVKWIKKWSILLDILKKKNVAFNL